VRAMKHVWLLIAEEFNDLAGELEDAGSAFGFADAHMEKLIATRNW
jgi:hypothetical protein